MSNPHRELDELRRREARLRSILETTVDGIVTISDRGVILHFNGAAERLFGYSADEVIGQNVNILMPEPHHTQHDQYIHRYLKTHDPHIIGIGREIEGRHKDGTLIPMELAVSESNVGDERYFTGILRDVTERKKAEKELREVNASLEAFARTLAHDLRSPLTAVTGFADLLLTLYEDTLDDKGVDFIQEILKGSQKMQSLIDDLLALARIGHVERPTEPTNVNLLVDDLIRQVENTNESSGCKIRRQGELPSVYVGQTLLLQLFQNLLVNACRYATSKKTPIDIVGVRNDGCVQYRVRDHGPGIPANERDRIFDTFYRGESVKDIPGSGIGLAIVLRTAQYYGGNAWVEDTPGGGATFVVELQDTPDSPT